ncbi:MAG TPA: hypothetical protein VJ867_15080 [Gemmatimonadaceae bacterium]|nr:hypothetical protein [Gemmatimonadaceae bacterium]
MRQNLALTISSLVSLVLTTLHIADDIMHVPSDMDTTGTIIILTIMVVLLYATVELAGRRTGYVILLLGGLAALYMPFLHPLGPRATRWGFFFVWTLIALGVSGAFTAILAGSALWRSFRRRPA